MLYRGFIIEIILSFHQGYVQIRHLQQKNNFDLMNGPNEFSPWLTLN